MREIRLPLISHFTFLSINKKRNGMQREYFNKLLIEKQPYTYTLYNIKTFKQKHHKDNLKVVKSNLTLIIINA